MTRFLPLCICLSLPTCAVAAQEDCGAALSSAGHGVDSGVLEAEGAISAPDYQGSFRESLDLATGRSSLWEDLGGYDFLSVYDGHTLWRRDFNGGVRPLDAPDARAGAITDAYLARHGYRKSAEHAGFACLGERTEGTRRFIAVQVMPQGGRPVELWVDAGTQLLDRSIQVTPTDRETLRYADYREVGGLRLPFRLELSREGEPGAEVKTVTRYTMLASAPQDAFSRPPGPKDYGISGGAGAVTVPLRLDHGVIFFDVMLQGKGPFAFILDPGAEGDVSGDALQKLGLPRDASTAHLDVAIGAAHLDKLPLQVFPGDGSGLYPKHDPAGPPIAGALGPEILERFALRLDYAAGKLTLIPLDTFKYTGKGVAVPLVFQDDIPLIPASADGVAGLFEYDVRAPSKLMLFGPFLQSHGFLTRYNVQSAAAATMVPETLAKLEIAGVTLTDEPANFGAFTQGKFSSRTEAGLLAYGVLSRFVTTLDYKDGIIYFELPTPPG